MGSRRKTHTLHIAEIRREPAPDADRRLRRIYQILLGSEAHESTTSQKGTELG